jgi:hypothetical protein
MSPADTAGPAPEARNPRLLWLLFGASAGPLFWLGQIVLAYGISAWVCYPADHPVRLSHDSVLPAALLAFDALALAGCAAGAIVSWRIRQRLRTGDSRNRFLTLWGLMSSLWFFAAILFNAIASLAVPACPV